MERDVPYIVHEGVMARMERTIRRLWILCIIMFLSLIASNAAWIYYESQWEVIETMTVTQDLDASDGGNAIINDGVHINGEGETDSN